MRPEKDQGDPRSTCNDRTAARYAVMDAAGKRLDADNHIAKNMRDHCQRMNRNACKNAVPKKKLDEWWGPGPGPGNVNNG